MHTDKPLPRHDRTMFLKGDTSKYLLTLNCLLAATYFLAISFAFEAGNAVLFGLLIAGEVFHLIQIFGYCYTIWDKRITNSFDIDLQPPVDIFITVCGEPLAIVAQTVRAAQDIDYPHKEIYILNDGFVAGKDNWHDMERLAKKLGVRCITRKRAGGAKAGNINNALRHSSNPYIAVFDADHVPHTDFLKHTMGYFVDTKMGFVQTPQFYHNQHSNGIAQTAWDQQTLFFGPIMAGKNRLNSAFMCGTNMVLNRKALQSVGGMCEFNIAEDFLTSLFVHAKGWKSVYVSKVLAEGLSPEDFLSYYKQQYRWTRGSLEVIFKYNPLFMRGLSWQQKLQYLISASYYLSGVVVLIDALLPVIYLYSGVSAVSTNTMTLAMVFLPYIFVNLFALQKSSNYSYNFNAIAFSLGSFHLQIKAIVAVLLNQKTSFVVTSKQQVKGNFLYLVWPQIAYIVIVAVGILVALVREGLTASLLANLAWALVNVAVFVPFIIAATPNRTSGAEAEARRSTPNTNAI